MSNAPLFENQLSLQDRINYIEKLLESKCENYFITLGINKSYNGPIDHCIHGTIRTKDKESFTLSRPAENFSELVDKLIESLESQLKK